MRLVIDIPEDVYKRTVFYREFKDLNDCVTTIKALENGTPLPKGHGRLIDADALEKKMCDREEELGDDRAMWESSAVSVAMDMFAPTIIEADKESVE